MLLPNTPDISSLDLFITVSELGSLGQAASKHSISQPAASAKMNQLERQLALKLLLRDKKGTRLTPVGKQMLPNAQRVVSEMQSLISTAKALRAEQDGHLRIAASFTVAEYLLGSWMERLTSINRNLTVTLEVGNSSKVLQSVADRFVDIGFVEGFDCDLKSFASTVVGSDRLVVLVNPSHRWAKRKTPVTGLELASTEIITREFGSGTRYVLEEALRATGGFRYKRELGSTTAILRAAKDGGGPAVLSRIAAADDLEAKRLVEVETSGIELNRDFHAVWIKGHSLTGTAKELLSIIKLGRD